MFILVLSGLLSCVTLLCELGCAVHCAAREHLGLFKYGLYKKLYSYFKQVPNFTKVRGWGIGIF